MLHSYTNDLCIVQCNYNACTYSYKEFKSILGFRMYKHILSHKVVLYSIYLHLQQKNHNFEFDLLLILCTYVNLPENVLFLDKFDIVYWIIVCT